MHGVQWTGKNKNSRKRKLLTMNGGFHPRNCVKRLFVPKKMGGN